MKPTTWNTLKTESINFDENFVWFDDFPMTAEKKVLEASRQSSYLITVNLQNAEELKRIINILKR